MSSLDLNFGLINMNMTEKLVENIQESYKSWKICQEDYKQFEQQSTRAASRGLNKEEADSILEAELLQLSSSLLEEDNPYSPRLSVVDQRLRQTLRKHQSKAEDADGEQAQVPGHAGAQRTTEKVGGEHGRPDQDMITPYVIVNKTDLTIVAHRLQRRTNNARQSFQDLLKAQIEQEISELNDSRPRDSTTITSQRSTSAVELPPELQPQEKKKLKNVYKIQ